MTLRKLAVRVAGASAVATAIVLSAPSPALAKMPLEARIEGPGIETAIVVRQPSYKEIWAADDPVRLLAERTGFWNVIANGAPLESARPPGDLGQALTVTFADWAVLEVYPYAEGGPWSNVAPSGSHGWPEATGWVRSDPELVPLLRDLGAPLTLADDADSAIPPVLVGAAAVVALAAVGATAWRLLRRSTHPGPAAARPHP